MEIGLSTAQVGRVLDGPADEPVYIVELLRFADDTGDLYRPYAETLTAATESNGGRVVWRGSLDHFVLGPVRIPYARQHIRHWI